MISAYTCINTTVQLEDTCRVHPCLEYQKNYVVRPGATMPIVVPTRSGPKFVLARWGLSGKNGNTYLMDTRKILVKKPFGLWFRKNRCAVPANCFFVSDRHSTHLVRILKERLFLLGGIYAQEGDNYHFVLLLTEAADVLQGIIDQSPVVMSAHKADKWTGDTKIMEVMQMIDRSGAKWYDYYPVQESVLEEQKPDAQTLRPTGLSFREWNERDEKLKATGAPNDRFDRNNSKGRR